MTKFFEDNGGGIHAVVFGADGSAENVLSGFQNDKWDVGELLRSAMLDFDGADEYDSFCGVDLQSMALEIVKYDELIAEFSDQEINLYPAKMGVAGKVLFGLDGGV